MEDVLILMDRVEDLSANPKNYSTPERMGCCRRYLELARGMYEKLVNKDPCAADALGNSIHHSAMRLNEWEASHRIPEEL